MVSLGLVIGLAGAVFASRALQRFLFQTQAADPLVVLSVSAALLGAGFTASYLPASRASRVDPATSLRME
jgi:ABC-type antimicrobial peptide transport system permease subunit